MGVLRMLWRNRRWLVRLVEVLEGALRQGLSNRRARLRLARKLADGLVLTDEDLNRLRAASQRAQDYVRNG